VRLGLFLVLLIIITGTPFSQQDAVFTMDNAVTEALKNSAHLKFKEYQLHKAEGFLTKAGLLPNPTVSFYKEVLSNHTHNFYEWTASGSMPINFLWERWSAVNSASAFYEAEKLNYEQTRFNLISDVKSAFVRVHFTNEINNAWLNALIFIDEAKKTAQARESEGDISGYDQQRILLEYFLYEKNVSDAKIHYQNSLNEFSLLILSTGSEKNIRTVFDFKLKDTVSLENIESLLDTAKQNRFDLKSAHHQLESRSSFLSNERIKIIPEVSLSLGYKKQSDDMRGFVYGINLSIPLFNRNQGDIKIAEAELNQQGVSVEILRKKIETDLYSAYKKVKEYEERLLSLKQYEIFDSDEIISTAKFSYEEGEMSLVELIDAIRAYTESFLLKNELYMNYYLSLFELEKVISKELIK
jgi:outer membrane protein, heavy metal efflux system